MSKRQRYHKKPLVSKTATVYEDEWNECREILDAEGSSISKFIRDKVQSKIKSHNKGKQ